MDQKAQLTLEEIEALLGAQGPDADHGGFGDGGLTLPHPPLARSFAALRAREHVGLVYETQDERGRIARQFLLAGLRKGELCVVVHQPEFLDGLRVALQPEMAAADLPGQLVLLTEAELADGGGRPDYRKLRERLFPAVPDRSGAGEAPSPLPPPAGEGASPEGGGAGRAGREAAVLECRLVREPIRLPAGGGRVDAFLAGEVAFDHDFCSRVGCTALTMLARGLEPPLLKAALSTHQDLVTGGRFYRNICAVPFSRYGREDASELEIRRMLRRIAEHHAAGRKGEFLEEVFRKTTQPFVATQPDGGIVTCNPAFAAMTGYSLDEIRMLHFPDDLVPPEWQDLNAAMRSDLLASRRNQRFETEIMRKNGTRAAVRASLDLLADDAGGPDTVVSFVTDLGERGVGNATIVRSSSHGAMAILPSRSFFLDRLAQALVRAKRRLGYKFTVQVLEMERITQLSRCFGASPLDSLIDSVSSRLDKNLRSLDTPAHLDSNQFAILLEEIGDATNAVRVAQRVQEQVCKSFNIKGCDVTTSCSVGIAMGTGDYDTPEHVLRDASAALERAKARPGKAIELFDSLAHDRAMKFLQLEQDLQRAQVCNELAVLFQPIIDLRTGVIRGFETLLRWNHPDRGMLLPAEFLPVAESTGLIHPIEQWVLREACNQLRDWKLRFGGVELFVSVNISRKNFLRLGFIRNIEEILEDTGVSPRDLKLEVTEAAIMDNPDLAKGMFDALASREIDMWLDNFGTGSSSLSLIHDLPIDSLKIDGSVLRSFGMVRSIVDLGRKLDIKVVSEGIETDAEADQLRSIDCRYGQGFLFSRPVGKEDSASLLGQQLA